MKLNIGDRLGHEDGQIIEAIEIAEDLMVTYLIIEEEKLGTVGYSVGETFTYHEESLDIESVCIGGYVHIPAKSRNAKDFYERIK